MQTVKLLEGDLNGINSSINWSWWMIKKLYVDQILDFEDKTWKMIS